MTISFRTAALSAVLLAAPALVTNLAFANLAFGAGTKTYQVTGPVVEVTDTAITVEKGKEKWEIARDKDTKVTGELKPGAKVTIMYRMTATSIEAKGDKAAEKKK